MKSELNIDKEETNKTWLACAIDGEGSITIDLGSKCSLSPAIIVCNNHLGFVKFARYLLENEETVITKARDTYITQLRSREKVKVILQKILPYLIVKRFHAEIVIRFVKRKEPYSTSIYTTDDWYDYLLLRILNNRLHLTFTTIISKTLDKLNKYKVKFKRYNIGERQDMVKEAEKRLREEGYE